MNEKINRPPVEIRTKFSIRHEESPELWELFQHIAPARRSTAIVLMLSRLAMMEKAKGSALTPAPVAVMAPASASVPSDRGETRPAASQPPQTGVVDPSNDVSHLLESFGAEGLASFLNYDQA